MSQSCIALPHSTKSHTQKLVAQLRHSGEDFEFYPTTPQIIDRIQRELKKDFSRRDDESIYCSILDCGAGDGRVLSALTSGSKYAIEKATALLTSLPRDIYVVGTDFHQQTLIDKQADVVFSNPPYEQFEQWACKIIKEAYSRYVYLVLPTRWESSEKIAGAVEARKAETSILGTYDFLTADREARANVHLIKVSLQSNRSYYASSNVSPKVDSFELWFDENFPLDAQTRKTSESEKERSMKGTLSQRIEAGQELVKNEGLVNVLDQFYKRDMAKLTGNYQAVCALDSDLLKELDVNVTGLKEALKMKLDATKRIYWQQLFDRLGSLTNRLTSGSRKLLLDKLQANTHVDYTPANAHAIVLWAIKNANQYFDDQLIDVVESMITKANIVNYKSNMRTIGQNEWRYLWDAPKDLSHYRLELRIIVERVGGLSVDWSSTNGLSERAAKFVDDLTTIAYNLGYDTLGRERANSHDWTQPGVKVFTFMNHSTGKIETLFEAKAFQKGTVHLKFNQRFICQLNVEFGRLKGWLNQAQEAAEELQTDLEDVQQYFKSNHVLTAHGVMNQIGYTPTVE